MMHLHDLTTEHIGAWFSIDVPKPYKAVEGKVQYLGSYMGGLPPLIAAWCSINGHHDPTFTFMWYNFEHPWGEVRQFTEAFTELTLHLLSL